MKRLRLWYNANRKSIWKIIGIVVIAIATLQLVQYIWKETQLKSGQEQAYVSNVMSNIENSLNSIKVEADKSVVTGEKITQGQISSLETLNTFISNCNEGKVTEAYEMLSDDCKKEMYPKIENFRNGYYNIIFSGKKKNTSVENWTGNIYKVTFMEDALSTGVYEAKNTVQDYITLVPDENGNIKINVNNYIGKQEMNKEQEACGIKAKVIQKDTYMDYEIYTFEITNNLDTVILLNNKNNADTMYLESTNGNKYTAQTHEIQDANLKIESRETRTIRVKYYSKYVSSKKIKKIVFEKVILDYNAYINYRNPGYYQNFGIIEIDVQKE